MAKRLNGRAYGSETDRQDELDAKESGLLIIYGYSDDNMEARGVQTDEFGCYGGGEFTIGKSGILPTPDDDEREILEKFGVASSWVDCPKIKAVWEDRGFSWSYETSLPHAKFVIYEDDEEFCQGIVIDTADIN